MTIKEKLVQLKQIRLANEKRLAAWLEERKEKHEAQ